MCDIAARVRGDFKILINSVLCVDEDLNNHFLPVDFDQTKEAIKTNIATKQKATEAIKNGIPLVIFPLVMSRLQIDSDLEKLLMHLGQHLLPN